MLNRAGMGRFAILLVTSVISSGASLAANLMPAAQENAVVQKYCGSCHSDALMYGGMSVEHFDAAHPDPTLAAMLLSKLTRGHTPKEVLAADSAQIAKMMKASAMGAAGMGVPDEKTQIALSNTLAHQSKGTYVWNVTSVPDRTVTASIVREVKRETTTDSYRLTVSCRADTGKGEIKVAWADAAPKEGQITLVSVDGSAAFQQKLEGGRAQGNGDNGPGATILNIPLPSQRLTVGSLFSDEYVVFPFGDLNATVRRDLSTCFTATDTGH